MFPKTNRADKKTINMIFKEGRFIKSTYLTLRFFINKDTTPPQISFVVPKPVAKSAVKRNLLRRRGYLVLNKYLDKFPNGFKGAMLFNPKSLDVFGGKYNKSSKSLLSLNSEINIILNKLNFNEK